MSTNEKAKEAAGKAAAELVKDGMLVGLGTGSTAAFFIDELIERCRQGLKITAVATSIKSQDLARSGNIPMANVNEITSIDLTIDGADEIDSQKRMIKGGGGALVREKILASISKEMVVVVDDHKVVELLGAFPLPVEIIPFAYKSTIHKLDVLGYKGTLRNDSQGLPYVTDNGNYIYDVKFTEPLENPEIVNQQIRNIVGVVETGFFFHMAGRVIIGYSDGKVKIRS